MNRRGSKRAKNEKIAKIKNINIIEKKLKQSLIVKKDVFKQITLYIYKIGLKNKSAKKIVFKGSITDVLDWCTQKQSQMKSVFDGYLNNIRNNSDRISLLKYTKQLRDSIIKSNLYDQKCFKILNKFIKDFSSKNPQKQLKDSEMVAYIDGKKGIKETINLYRQIVTSKRVSVLKSLKSYYVNSDNKENYKLGLTSVQKAIDNNQILNIQMKNIGAIKIRHKQVKSQKWVLFGQLLNDNNEVVKNVIICHSDIKK